MRNRLALLFTQVYFHTVFTLAVDRKLYLKKIYIKQKIKPSESPVVFIFLQGLPVLSLDAEST